MHGWTEWAETQCLPSKQHVQQGGAPLWITASSWQRALRNSVMLRAVRVTPPESDGWHSSSDETRPIGGGNGGHAGVPATRTPRDGPWDCRELARLRDWRTAAKERKSSKSAHLRKHAAYTVMGGRGESRRLRKHLEGRPELVCNQGNISRNKGRFNWDWRTK